MLLASFLALFVHALFYSGFLEDPLTWLVLAVGAGTQLDLGRASAPSGAHPWRHGRRVSVGWSGRSRRGPPRRPRRETLDSRGAWALVGVLFGLVAIALPELGSDPWRFRPGSVDPQGLLAPLVRAAGEEWDVGIARAAAFVAALLCGAAALFLLARRRPRAGRAGPAWRSSSWSRCS